ncbi:MAG: cren protein [archaeon GB-1845-036]|nr:cren protein [Candidatus Culexmicrobium thermophilum]
MNTSKDPELPSPVAIKVNDLEDLARFVASIAGLGQPTYILHFMLKGKHVVGLMAIYRDYYKYYGIPVFYYFESEKPIEGNYFLVKAEENREHVVISKGTRPGWIAIPIIRLKEKPIFLKL